MPVQSTYNVVVPLPGRSEHVLFNMLSGTLDVIDGEVAAALAALKPEQRPADFVPMTSLLKRRATTGEELALPEDVINYLDGRGYLYASQEEERFQSNALYENLMQLHRKSVRQPIVVIPSYNCDLKCPYCWQRLYHMDSDIMTEDMAKHLFTQLPNVIEDPSRPDRVDFIIFGGEPLQDVEHLRQRVLQLLDMAREKGYSTKIISNGVGLGPNVPHIRGKVECIQVTIDGPADVHTKRRPLPGQKDSFTPMAEGIDRAVEAGIHINVRVNTDESNLYTLPDLVEFADKRGWLKTRYVRFHIAPVKNHNPRKETNSESALLVKVLELVSKDERMKSFDLTGFPGIKYFQGFKETGLFSLHRFFNCEAQINFFAFDLYGDVYACWDAAGLKHLSVGKFDPNLLLFSNKLSQWRHRTSLDIESCGGCTASPHCGGGCQFLALEHNNTFSSSNCDSVLEGYVQSITANADWVVEHAQAGDHAVGLVTRDRIVEPTARCFGFVESGAEFGLACG